MRNIVLLLLGFSLNVFGQSKQEYVLVDINEMTLDALRKENSSLRSMVNRLETIIDSLSSKKNLQTEVAENEDSNAALYPNYPNPAREKTTISYNIDRDLEGPVSIILLDERGKEVRRFEDLPIGLFSKRVDTKKLRAGSYLIQLSIDDRIIDRGEMIVSK